MDPAKDTSVFKAVLAHVMADGVAISALAHERSVVTLHELVSTSVECVLGGSSLFASNEVVHSIVPSICPVDLVHLVVVWLSLELLLFHDSSTMETYCRGRCGRAEDYEARIPGSDLGEFLW